jgi:hypothetical protein
MRAAAAVIAVAALLCACGGGETERRMPAAPNAELLFAPSPGATTPAASTYSWKPVGKLVPIEKRPEIAPAALAAATSDEAAFSFEDEEGQQLKVLELRPVRGKGYPELRIVLKARRIGDTAPASAISPACATDTRCDYQLSRRYTVAIADGKSMRLVPRDGFIAAVGRELEYDVPRAVEVRISAENGLLSSRRVVLLTGD